MSAGAKLIQEYNCDLMSENDIRLLVKSVSQDPQNETVDFEKSKLTVREASRKIFLQEGGPALVGSARRKIIGWLNSVYFTDKHLTKDGRTGLPVEWWWEMHTRIQKLLVVSMILEGDNLRSFGVTVQLDDIPQALIGIYEKMCELRKVQFPALKAAYLLRVMNMDPTYVELYLDGGSV
jgi:hypothetical protein